MKNIYKITIFAVLLLILPSSCIEPFYPEINQNVGALVVDGKITNQKDLHEIKLFRTLPLFIRDTLSFENEANITLYDDKGNILPYYQSSEGTYSLIDSLVGIVGNSYWIEIELEDGSKFESTPEIMNPPVEITDLYGEEEEIVFSLDSMKKGVRFYFDAVSNSKNLHIRWEYNESWEWYTFFEPKPPCYPIVNSNVVRIFDAKYLRETNINHLPAALVTENEVKLNYEYVLNMKLYSISEEAYGFWNNLKNISQNTGGLYDVIPSNLQGNIQVCENGIEYISSVVGYFEVASVSEKVAAFDITKFDIDFPNKDKVCDVVVFIDVYPPGYYVLRSEVISGGGGTYVEHYVVPNYCTDCSLKFPLEKPSFWP